MHSEPSANDLQRFADTLPAWKYNPERRALHRRLSFASFGEALGAMVRIGVEADKRDHHPEWANVYNTVDIWLTTHDAGGVSNKDENLASAIDRMFP
ncbi:pterin-4-alpha-carbinolamine dehydratase [Sphingomonas sp. Leaf208]|uniref:4a-hydroxytetrahydrobiopterin dehydratase n=1 Tax=Sphingomonas sp. Leaf208 TaxID=1735679 RepID=UPI0006F3B703|nr:4a-hydroxytetrahydrobiopterin dehydratase [Sphingomonas sp. Leaf208]KQM54518.1 pterin-4-alpha-carbinolamine dehydratase [Sphingomonas sp. Leaf208]